MDEPNVTIIQTELMHNFGLNYVSMVCYFSQSYTGRNTSFQTLLLYNDNLGGMCCAHLGRLIIEDHLVCLLLAVSQVKKCTHIPIPTKNTCLLYSFPVFSWPPSAIDLKPPW